MALARYFSLLAFAKDDLSPAELNLIKDCCLGWNPQFEPPETQCDGLLQQVRDAIADDGQSLSQKWGINTDDLLKKLLEMDELGLMAIVQEISPQK